MDNGTTPRCGAACALCPSLGDASASVRADFEADGSAGTGCLSACSTESGPSRVTAVTDEWNGVRARSLSSGATVVDDGIGRDAAAGCGAGCSGRRPSCGGPLGGGSSGGLSWEVCAPSMTRRVGAPSAEKKRYSWTPYGSGLQPLMRPIAVWSAPRRSAWRLHARGGKPGQDAFHRWGHEGHVEGGQVTRAFPGLRQHERKAKPSYTGLFPSQSRE